jgi:hypothetical protein
MLMSTSLARQGFGLHISTGEIVGIWYANNWRKSSTCSSLWHVKILVPLSKDKMRKKSRFQIAKVKRQSYNLPESSRTA